MIFDTVPSVYYTTKGLQIVTGPDEDRLLVVVHWLFSYELFMVCAPHWQGHKVQSAKSKHRTCGNSCLGLLLCQIRDD